MSRKQTTLLTGSAGPVVMEVARRKRVETTGQALAIGLSRLHRGSGSDNGSKSVRELHCERRNKGFHLRLVRRTRMQGGNGLKERRGAQSQRRGASSNTRAEGEAGSGQGIADLYSAR